MFYIFFLSFIFKVVVKYRKIETAFTDMDTGALFFNGKNHNQSYGWTSGTLLTQWQAT